MKLRYYSSACLLMAILLLQNEVTAQTVTYLPSFTDATFAAKAINTALPVGSTAAAAEVSGSGGATYTIPLAVPLGTNGVGPQMSLNYNSQGGDGPVGMGWQVGGISEITRVSKNFYFDGEARGVDLSTNDRFALDGMRLLSKSGTYGADASTYATEAESFATITAKGTSGGGPTWFEVQAKDGSILEYGNTTDSRYPASGTTKLAWRLSKIRYRDGNYITFTYGQGAFDWILTEVAYTGNTVTGQIPFNKIQFQYLGRTDGLRYFSAGLERQNFYLLHKIVITGEGGATFKSYGLNYHNETGSTKLRELTEVGADNSQLNSTIFQYGNPPTAFQTASSSIVAGQAVDVFSGDFDGDGYSDLLAASYAYSGGQKYHTDFKVYKRTASSSAMTLACTQTLPSHSLVKNSSTFNRFFVSDFNGDGADDIVTARLTYGSSYHTLEGVDIYTSNGAGTAFAKTTLPPYSLYPGLNLTGNILFPGDYNGDGIQDLLLLAQPTAAPNNTQAFMYLGGINTGFVNVGQTGTFQINETAWGGADQVLAADFDGDGATDLFVTANGRTEIYRLRSYYFEAFYSSTYPGAGNRYFPGDFNGDGKTDLLAQSISSNQWTRLLSTGKEFWTSSMTFNHTPSITGTYSDDKMVVADINGDGRTDIIHGWSYFSGGVSTSSRIDVYTGLNNTFAYKQYTYGQPLGYSSPAVFDFDGDGRAEFIDRYGYTNPFTIFQFNKGGQEHQIKRVKNGVGHVTEWVYKRMNEAGSFYTRGALSTAEIRNVQLPLYLTYELRRDNGIGGTSTVRYAYEGAKLNRTGKGFLGMSKVTADDLAMGMRSVQELSFNSTYNAAAPYRSSTYLIGSANPLQQTTLTTEFVSTGTKRYFLRTNSSSTNHALEGYTATDTYTYDTYGNVTQHTTANGVESITTTTGYAALGTAGTPVPALPISVTVSRTRSGQAAYSVVTTYAYNSLGQLSGEVNYSGKPKSVAIAYSYDNLGYRKTTTMTPTGLSARSTTSIYDAKGRYPLTITDPIGLITTYQYDTRWGTPTKITTPDGLSSTMAYDAYGRRTSSTVPDGYTITESYGWAVSTTDRTVSYQLVQHPGQADVKVWYDLLGRDKKRQTEGFGGNWATEVWTYDARGNRATSTLPYKSGETVLTTTTTYDNYNRPTTVTNSQGTTKYGYAYTSGNLTTTLTNAANQVSSTVTDRSGKTTGVTDYGGTLSYVYNSQGNLTQVKLGTTVVTTTGYDEQGRQKSLYDPNSGTTQYEYDALGQLTKQTNASGQITTTVYDKLGRPTSRTGAEGTTTYEYYATGQAAATGKLKKITGFTTNNAEEYTYDTKGRTATHKVTIDGVAHTTTYGYDTYGRASLTTYPSGLAVQNVYDGSGQLTSFKQNGGATLFTATAANGLGQYTNYSLGNGKASTNNFTFGTPTRYYTPGVQDLRFEWNFQSGNLNSRNDALKVKSESFTYDNLNRLTGATPTNQPVHATAYRTNGNIASFGSTANLYSYDATRINAVVEVANPAGQVPSAAQTVTYTSYYQPDYISEGGYTMNITYGPDYERIKSVLKQGSTTKETRLYFDGFEKQTIGSTTKYIQYLSAGDGVNVIAVSQGSTHTFYYVYTDYLGSILTVTNATGAVVAEQNFDAWGRKRNPTTWAVGSLPTNPDWLIRGYTTHEDLPRFGLVNMNGRLYDPGIGRMLSVDNHLQAPTSTQGFNRFSYALNNPLKFVDPNGEIAFLAIVAIGATIGAISGGISGGWEGAWKGAIVGAVGAAIPQIGFIGALGNVGAGAIAGAVTGGLNAGLYKQNILKGALIGAAVGAAFGLAQDGLAKAKAISQARKELIAGGYDPKGAVSMNSDDLLEFALAHDELRGMYNEAGMPALEAGRPPNGYRLGSDGLFQDAKGQAVKGVTRRTGNSISIHVSPRQFTSAMRLYANLGHELSHAVHFNTGLFSAWSAIGGNRFASAASEVQARVWSLEFSRRYAFDLSQQKAAHSFFLNELYTIPASSFRIFSLLKL